jgi:hypothetical protein
MADMARQDERRIAAMPICADHQHVPSHATPDFVNFFAAVWCEKIKNCAPCLLGFYQPFSRSLSLRAIPHHDELAQRKLIAYKKFQQSAHVRNSAGIHRPNHAIALYDTHHAPRHLPNPLIFRRHVAAHRVFRLFDAIRPHDTSGARASGIAARDRTGCHITPS